MENPDLVNGQSDFYFLGLTRKGIAIWNVSQITRWKTANAFPIIYRVSY